MRIITQTPGPEGAYPPIQEGNFTSVPEGTALWPEALPTDEFYQYNGFVTLDIQEEKGVATVAGYQPNVAAWETWKSAQAEEPEPPVRQPTADELLDVLLGEGEQG